MSRSARRFALLSWLVVVSLLPVPWDQLGRGLAGQLDLSVFASLASVRFALPVAAPAEAAGATPTVSAAPSSGAPSSAATPTPSPTPTSGGSTLSPRATVTPTPSPTASGTPSATPSAAGTPTPAADAGPNSLPTLDRAGGSVPLPVGGRVQVPANALSGPTVFSSELVERPLARAVERFHPLARPVLVDGRQASDRASVGKLGQPLTVTLAIDRPETKEALLKSAAVRQLTDRGWQKISSHLDLAARTLAVEVTALPATLVVVDDSQPPVTDDWDPTNPAAVQLADGSWAVAAIEYGALVYRRSLGGEPLYWTNAQTIEPSNASLPSLTRSGSTLLLAYTRQTSGNHIYARTSTDDGVTWSSAIDLDLIYYGYKQVRAVADGATLYVFWTYGIWTPRIQYRASTNGGANWAATAQVNRGLSTDTTNVLSITFDLKKLSSGSWLLAWMDQHGGNSTIGVSTASSLGGTWSTRTDATSSSTESWVAGPALAEAGDGTVYLGYDRQAYPWDYYAIFRTSSDGGATWGSPTVFGYDPARGTGGYTGVQAADVLLAADANGGVRAFWDQPAQSYAGPDPYPTRLFRRDLPSGGILALPPSVDVTTKEGLDARGDCHCADPVSATTGNFTLSETDVAIPGRGVGLVFERTYNATQPKDGPLGYGWTFPYDTRLSTFTHGEVLIIDRSGRRDLYTPAGGGAYSAPPGRLGSVLVHNGNGTWTLKEANQATQTFSATGKLTAVADRNGNTTSLTYDGSGKLTTITEPGGRTLSVGWTSAHITSVTDPLSRAVSYGYSGAGDLTSVTDPRGKVWSYTYDSSHHLLTKVDPLSHTVLTNTYGTLERVKTQQDAKNQQTSFSYAAAGGSTTVTDPLGNATTYAYDLSYRVTQVTDPYSKVVKYTWDSTNNLTKIEDQRKSTTDTTNLTYDSRGNVLTRQNGLNHTWTYTYNSLNEVLTATDPLSHTTTLAYNGAGDLTSITNAKSETTTLTTNSAGQVTSVTDARSKTTSFGYDSYGNQTTVTDPYSKTWTLAYDLGGRKTSITDPLSHVTSFAYDNTDNLTSMTDARGKTTSFSYDDANRRTSVTDPNSKTTSYAYDEKNRLTSVTDAASGVTSYAYNARDSLTSATDAKSHSRSWTYDKLQRVLTEVDALSKTTTFEYDGAGNRTKRTDATGAVTTYSYDTINRRTGITEPSGTASVTYSYDAANHLTSMVDGTGTTSYTLDELGRPTAISLPGSRTLAYQYDAAGNRTRITYPDSKTVDYSYRDDNRLASVTDWLSKVTSYSYDDAGRLTATSYPTGVTEARTYTDADQLLTLTATKSGTTLTSFSYTLDNAGLRTAVQTLAGTESYTFDNLYRLTGVTYADSTTQAYTYDAVGNRLTKVQGGTTTTYSYDNADRLTAAGGVSYTFDHNGNLTARGSDSFGWDAENRLTSATVGGTSASYAYRADGLRESKTVGGTTTTYTWDLNSGLPVVLQDGTYSYVYGLGLISQTDGSGTQTYFLANGLGSTEALTDSSGTVTATYQYDVFGAVRASTGTASSEYRFTGQQDDAALGLTYLRARYYDQATGRFLSKDPARGDTMFPQSHNRYAYGVNNPTIFVDPSGKVVWVGAIIATGALVGGAINAINYVTTADRVTADGLTGAVVYGMVAGATGTAAGVGVAAFAEFVGAGALASSIVSGATSSVVSNWALNGLSGKQGDAQWEGWEFAALSGGLFGGAVQKMIPATRFRASLNLFRGLGNPLWPKYWRSAGPGSYALLEQEFDFDALAGAAGGWWSWQKQRTSGPAGGTGPSGEDC